MSLEPVPVGARVRLVRPIGSYPAGSQGTVAEYRVSLLNGFDVTVSLDGGDGRDLLNFYADEIEAVGDIAERESSE